MPRTLRSSLPFAAFLLPLPLLVSIACSSAEPPSSTPPAGTSSAQPDPTTRPDPTTHPDGGTPDPDPNPRPDPDDEPVEPGCIAPRADRQWGTDRDDRASVTIGRSGAVFLYGSTNGYAADNLEPGAGAEGFLERWDGDTLTWSSTPRLGPGSSVDIVSIDAFDRLSYVGRVFEGGQSDLVIGEISPHGVQTSWTQVGNAPPERPFELLIDGDHRAIVGHDDVYIPSNYVEAWEDPFVYRWDRTGGAASGSFVHDGTPIPDVATGAALGTDGKIVVVGGATGSSSGSFVSRVGSTFEPRTWGHKGLLDMVRSIRRLPDGDYLIAGSTGYQLGARAFGQQDAFVARLAPDLTTERWVTQIGSEEGDIVVDLVIDVAGRSWVLGETLGTVAAPSAGQVDLFVTALDANGNVRWSAQRGSSGDERPTRIAVDACENVLVAGATDGPLVPGIQPRGFDAFVLTIGHDHVP